MMFCGRTDDYNMNININTGLVDMSFVTPSPSLGTVLIVQVLLPYHINIHNICNKTFILGETYDNVTKTLLVWTK